MIRFVLNCGRDHEFEGWFRNGEAFERQVADGDLVCPFCADGAIRKAVMAPAVARSRSSEPAAVAAAAAAVPAPATPAVPLPGGPQHQAKLAMLAAMARQVREHVEKNFENVGDRFVEEARRIHSGDAEARDIFGRASLDDARELVEDGIPVRPLPELPKLDG
jgi:hypothetical protein